MSKNKTALKQEILNLKTALKDLRNVLWILVKQQGGNVKISADEFFEMQANAANRHVETNINDEDSSIILTTTEGDEICLSNQIMDKFLSSN